MVGRTNYGIPVEGLKFRSAVATIKRVRLPRKSIGVKMHGRGGVKNVVRYSDRPPGEV